MNASDIMTCNDLHSSADVSDARAVARMMAFHNVAAIPVLDTQGGLEGIITDRDLCCRVIAEGRSLETPITELMTRPVRTVGPDASVDEVETIMRECRIRHLPVVDDENRMLGFISLSDLARCCSCSGDADELVSVLTAVSPVTHP